MGALTLLHGDGAIYLTAAGARLARYVYTPDVAADESPRPFLHPVRTLTGAPVTDLRPADHPWHHGLSLAVPYVGATNLWGGRTWDSRSRDYVDLHNNGRMRHDSIALTERRGRPGFVEALTWLTADGTTIAAERRTLSFWSAENSWSLDWRSEITNTSGAPLSFASPATHGREGAGYGGIFLRAAPAFASAVVGTAARRDAPGERMLGAVGKWMELSTGGDSPVTVRMDAGVRTPWFVRTEEYPGFGPAPFFADEAVLESGVELELSCQVTITDDDSA